MSEKRADIILWITAVFWGLGYLGTDVLLTSGMNPNALVGARFLIAGITLSIIFHKRLKFRKQDLLGPLLVGIVLYLGFMTQTIAMNYTTTTNVSFITGTNVVFVPIFGYLFYKKTIASKHLVSVALTLIGIQLLTGGIEELMLGDLIAIIGAMFFALHIVLISHYSKKVDIIKLAVGQMIVCGVLALLVMPTTGVSMLGEIQKVNIYVLIWVGLIPSALCFLLQNIGLKYTDEARGSIILATESLWGAFFAILFLNEPFTAMILIGGTFLFSAVLVDEVNFTKFKKKVT